MEYSPELKKAAVARMLSPNREPLLQIAKDMEISEPTLRKWKKEARQNGQVFPDSDVISEKWSSEDKFLIVVETMGMNEIELAAYAREKGLFTDQIREWKDNCIKANGAVAKATAKLRHEVSILERERRKLEKTIVRKDKALAETAALLVLSKKANAIWGEPEGE